MRSPCRALGPGLLEKPYKLALANELLAAGLAFELDVPLTATYRGDSLGCSYYMDLVVEKLIVLEIKSVAQILPVHRAQLLTYLRMSGHPRRPRAELQCGTDEGRHLSGS